MPFNETNDYTARQQEKTWHITDNQQSLFPVLGLLQSRQHFWQHWAGWDEKWIAEASGVLKSSSHRATVGTVSDCLGFSPVGLQWEVFSSGTKRAGQEGDMGMWSHWEVYFLWGVCGSNAAEKLHSKNWMFLLIGCSFIPYSLCFIATVLYFYFLCLLLMLSSV